MILLIKHYDLTTFAYGGVVTKIMTCQPPVFLIEKKFNLNVKFFSQVPITTSRRTKHETRDMEQ